MNNKKPGERIINGELYIWDLRTQSWILYVGSLQEKLEYESQNK